MKHKNHDDVRRSPEHFGDQVQKHQSSEDLTSDDVFISEKVKQEIPETFSRERHQKKNPALKKFVIGVTILTIITISIIYSFHFENNRRAEEHRLAELRKQEYEKLPENFPPPGRSIIQDKLIDANWVDQDFLPINPYSRPGSLIPIVNGIVIHNIGNPNTTAQQNRNYFASLAQTHERHASAHFIICLDGSILQCVPVDEEAYASNERNFDTLAIEFCHPDETGEFTVETLNAAIFLTAWLCVEFNLTIDDVIRHHDIIRESGRQTDCPRYFVNNEDAWEAFKNAVAAMIIDIQ